MNKLGIPESTWWRRNLNNSAVQMEFNALQADITRQFNASEAEKSRVFSASEAEKNRQWQTEMSNSAYSRAVADMKSAGLNPYLAYSQGGASVPSGSALSGASASSPSTTMSAGSELVSLVGSALKLAGTVAGALIKKS